MSEASTMDPGTGTGIALVAKLISLGMKSWQALEHRELDKDDVEALRALFETGAAVFGMRKAPVVRGALLQVASIARAFGRAVGRHQTYHGKVALTSGLRRWLNHSEREREREISLRVKFALASQRPPELGNDPTGEISSIDSLIGDPLGTPYYRALWQSFSDPRLTIADAGESPPLEMSTTARRECERYFLLAYLEALAPLRENDLATYLTGIGRYRAKLIQDLLLTDLAAWGGRHVFGNVPRGRWVDNEAIPFIPLEEIYVEPSGVVVHNRQVQGSAEPLLALIKRLTAVDAEARVVIVTADFGSGKSLSARMLACRWAEDRLSSRAVSLDLVLPIYVRCAEDFPNDALDLEMTVRRAWKRQAEEVGHSMAVDDDSFAWPPRDQRAVYLLDGLDEVTLGEQHLKTLFQNLSGKSTRGHRFVVFSRPGALPAERDLGTKVASVHVLPFTRVQIEQWLARWNGLRSDDPPIGMEDFAHRELAAIVQTPILLFMVAFTWAQEMTTSWPPVIAEIYERFFQQIAGGKAGVDLERHPPIDDASGKLLAALRNARVLDASAKNADAMLWLLGRVAWEAHMLEQLNPPEVLTRLHVDNLLRNSGEVSLQADSLDAIRVGLVLTLQADLQGANHAILFGHRSFREFLVGRHWAVTLRRSVCSRRGATWDSLPLLGGRLLGSGDKSFAYLMQIINANGGNSVRTAEPMGWSNEERERLVEWAQQTVEDERQDFGEPARPRTRADTALRNDLRAALREAALAIGSMTRGTARMRMGDPISLRSMLARFWLTGEQAIVVARRVNLVGADLCEANLQGSDLSEADLSGANLRRANLRRANLRRANVSESDLSEAALHNADLTAAVFTRVDLSAANLPAAQLSGGSFVGADFSEANLCRANLRRADLTEARFIGANLSQTDLGEATLSRAILAYADLRGALLAGADLSGADLTGVKYGPTTRWPIGFDPPGWWPQSLDDPAWCAALADRSGWTALELTPSETTRVVGGIAWLACGHELRFHVSERELGAAGEGVNLVDVVGAAAVCGARPCSCVDPARSAATRGMLPGSS